MPPELSITEEFERPLERVDEAAFVAKTLGERFFAGLARHSLACTRLAIVATTSGIQAEHHPEIVAAAVNGNLEALAQLSTTRYRGSARLLENLPRTTLPVTTGTPP